MSVKKVIKEKGWTLEKLAAQMTNRDGTKGISQPSLSAMINGNPTIDKLKEIASIIGVSLSELVGDEETRTVTKCPHCGKPIEIRTEIIAKE